MTTHEKWLAVSALVGVAFITFDALMLGLAIRFALALGFGIMGLTVLVASVIED